MGTIKNHWEKTNPDALLDHIVLVVLELRVELLLLHSGAPVGLANPVQIGLHSGLPNGNEVLVELLGQGQVLLSVESRLQLQQRELVRIHTEWWAVVSNEFEADDPGLACENRRTKNKYKNKKK